MVVFRSLLLLWLVPMLAVLVARHVAGRFRWSIVGASFGLVVSPASLGLYSLYYVGPIPVLGWLGFAAGMVGLLLSMLHGTPGFELARHFNWLESKNVIEGLRDHTIIEGVNAVIWGLLYGSLGGLVDWLYHRHAHTPQLDGQDVTSEN